MWIQWSLTRLVRWRVRDWASCFTACRFPLEDETDGFRSSPSQLPIRNVVFDMKDESKGKRIGKKLLRRNRSNKSKCTRINLSSTSTQGRNNILSADQNTNSKDSSWPQFADEDYIVFCFREDGAFDVVKDCKSEAAAPNSTSRRSSWPVNQKLSYGDEAKTVNNSSSRVERSNEEGYDIFPTSEGDIIPVSEGEEEEIIYLDAESSSSSIRRRYQAEQEIENHGMVSIASSDSNQSDNSGGSFAFPVLGWEWMGSPAQMPKSEGLQLRKHKTISLSFQCCRF